MARFHNTTTNIRTSNGASVVVRRSAARKRTVSAFWEDGVAVVSVPASMSEKTSLEWVRTMLPRLEAPRRTSRVSDEELLPRAKDLSRRYLGREIVPNRIRWVDNQRGRWGSATPSEGTIRLSSALREMPQWVQDYVLIHELTHLLIPGHPPAFWELVARYPRAEEAKAFLAGVTFANSRGMSLTEA